MLSGLSSLIHNILHKISLTEEVSLVAQFGGMELTNAGRNLIAKALTGKTLKFSKAVAGTVIIDGVEAPLTSPEEIQTYTQELWGHS